MVESLALQDLTPESLVKSQDGFAELKKIKPNNWRDYLQAFLEEARSTGATAILPMGTGFESLGTYELLKDGKSMHAVIRLQGGGLPMPVFRYNGLLPFYREVVHEFPGDPHTDFDKRDSWKSTHGVRINVMPKVLRLPLLANEAGPVNDHLPEWEDLVDYSGIIHQQMNQNLATQGHTAVDNHPGNEGFYRTDSAQYIPVVFDPGSGPMYRYPATVRPGSKIDHGRVRQYLQQERTGEAAWMNRDIWNHIREEIKQDAVRLYNGEPTVYSERMQRVDAKVPVEALQQASRIVPRQRSEGMTGR